MITKSPLRYPGGKANLAGFLRGLIGENVGAGCTYFELYAGGAGRRSTFCWAGTYAGLC